MSSSSSKTVDCKVIESLPSSGPIAQDSCCLKRLPQIKACSLLSLPNELIWEIVKLLDWVSLIALARLNIRLYNMFVEEAFGKSNELLNGFMYVACREGNLECIKLAIAHGVSLNRMRISLGPGKLETIKVAMTKGLSFQQAEAIANRDEFEFRDESIISDSPLELAWMHRPEVIMFLIKSGANLDIPDDFRTIQNLVYCKEGCEFLESALKYGPTRLRDRMADLDMVETISSSKVLSLQLVKHILENGPYTTPIPEETRCWQDPLGIALRRGSIPLYKLLMDFGFNPNARDAPGYCTFAPQSIFWAIDDLLETGDMEMLDTVIQSKANVNVWSKGHGGGLKTFRYARSHGMLALTAVSYYLLSLDSDAKWNAKPRPVELLQYLAYYGGNLNPHERGRDRGKSSLYRIPTTQETWLVDVLKWKWGKKLCLNRNFIDVMRYMSVNGRVGDHLVKYLHWAAHEKRRAQNGGPSAKQNPADHVVR